MRFKNVLGIVVGVICTYFLSLIGSGCAQVGTPTGGARDTLAPLLVRANPSYGTLNFKGKTVTLTFSEYIEITDVQANVQTSPLQKINPEISAGLRTITIKLKDTLQPNTTYSINFGNAVKDVNEGNVYKDLTYVFSTGNYLDSLGLTGKLRLAETGAYDSTYKVLLYRNAIDTAVLSQKPTYITDVKPDGSFAFNNLPEASFKIYALKDGDGGKTYNSAGEGFAFLPNNASITLPYTDSSLNLFAYVADANAGKIVVAQKPILTPAQQRLKIADAKLRYTFAAKETRQDILKPLEVVFTNEIKTIDNNSFFITDTNYVRIASQLLTIDSTRKIVSLSVPWQPDASYILNLRKSGIVDSADLTLAKDDTLNFETKRNEDYGKITLRFNNLDLSKKPILQFLNGTQISYAFPLKSLEWTKEMFPPGEYSIQILYDNNGNGIWDPGNFKQNLQPERTIYIPQKIGIRSDFENESEITL